MEKDPLHGLEMTRAQRWFVGALLPLLMIGLTTIPLLLTLGDLPDPIAIHFDTDGSADGSAPLWLHVVVVALFTLGAATVLAWAAWRPTSGIGLEAAIATFIGFFFAEVHAVLMFANQEAPHWRDVDLGPGLAWGGILSSIGVAIPVLLMVRRTGAQGDAGRYRAVELRADDRVAWFGQARNVACGVAGAVLALVGAALVLGLLGRAGVGAGAAVMLAAVALAAFTQVNVVIGADGLRARAGGLRWPEVRIPLADIDRARPADHRPMQRGMLSGWGYRGSLRLLGRAAWVIRSGPALEVDLTRGRRFVVTVDHPDEAAALLNGLVERELAARTG